MKLTEEAISLFVKQYWSLQQIADYFDVSRQAVHKYLRNRGVDTSKRLVEVYCAHCGRPMMKAKCRVRSNKRHFCSRSHHRMWQRGKGH